MSPVLAPCPKLQTDGSSRLIRVERMDLFKNHLFNHVLSAGIVFIIIFEVSGPPDELNRIFIQNDLLFEKKVLYWPGRTSRPGIA